jgi:hypothetical protein
MLRDRFGINGNDKELIRNVLSNIKRISGDTGKVPNIMGDVPVRELCK